MIQRPGVDSERLEGLNEFKRVRELPTIGGSTDRFDYVWVGSHPEVDLGSINA